MDQTAGTSWRSREPQGVLGRHVINDPPRADLPVLASSTDVDPVLRRVPEGGVTPL